MEQPTLSICIPNYNHSSYISETLKSVIAQSVLPTEIIIVDDASSDNSVEVIEEFMKRYECIRLIKNSSNQGGIHAARRAQSEASGEYIYALAADDKVLPGFFEKSIDLLEKYPQAGLCAVAIKFIDPQGNFINIEKSSSIHTHESHVDIRTPSFLSAAEVLLQLRRQPWFLGGVSNTMFRRAALAEAGWQIPELGLLADWFASHFVALKYGMCYIPEPLVAFRIMSNSFGANIVRRPKVALDNHARAIRLMEDPKYCQVFPKLFIDSKRREFTYTSFRGSFVNWQHNFLQDLHELVPPQTLLGKGIIWLLHSLIRLQWLILKVYCYKNVAPVFREEKAKIEKNAV